MPMDWKKILFKKCTYFIDRRNKKKEHEITEEILRKNEARTVTISDFKIYTAKQ